MAINIESFGLPVVAGADTGVYELPDEQAERILQYVKSLFQAKSAGVLGQEIRSPQAYVDKVVRQRVDAARIGGVVWTSKCAEMSAEESAWRLRAADHSARTIKRDLATSGLTRDEAALVLAERAATLDPETRQRLEERTLEVIDRDRELTIALTLGKIDPRKASLYRRTLDRLAERSAVYARARELFSALGPGAWQAAIALSVWDDLTVTERGILYGPWAEVMDGDPNVLEGAWTEQADHVRRLWSDLPLSAIGWSPEQEADEF